MAFAAYLYCFRREPERALDAAEGAVRYSNEQALAQFQALATVVAGWAMSVTGKPDTGVARMQYGMAAWSETGSRLVLPMYQTLLAEGLEAAGRPNEALAALNNAVSIAESTEERFYQREIHRVRAQLTAGA